MTMHALGWHRHPPEPVHLEWITEPADEQDAEHALEEIHERVVQARRSAPARSRTRSPRRVHH